MGKFVVVILDGFGIGYMEDAKETRPHDVGANTFGSLARLYPDLKLPTLERLGLMNAAGFETARMKRNLDAAYGVAELAHFGADTFWGHQEIMGTKPQKPAEEPLAPYFDAVRKALVSAGYPVRIYDGAMGGRLLIVKEAVTVADNVECDPGLAVNVTAAIDDISFEESVRIGTIVRGQVTSSRVIVFGGSGVHLNDILAAVRENQGGYIGVSAPDSGVYERNYHCVHMGYGVDPKAQVPFILAQKAIPSFLLGKAADIVANPKSHEKTRNFPIVSTVEVLQKTSKLAEANKNCFICANVQETDLCGHRENSGEYLYILEQADEGIGKLLQALSGNDILVVMADHGNDPAIGHPHHTRERVPLLLYGAGLRPADIGVRRTLSDVAATAADYFGVGAPQNGKSFLGLITKPTGENHDEA